MGKNLPRSHRERGEKLIKTNNFLFICICLLNGGFHITTLNHLLTTFYLILATPIHLSAFCPLHTAFYLTIPPKNGGTHKTCFLLNYFLLTNLFNTLIFSTSSFISGPFGVSRIFGTR